MCVVLKNFSGDVECYLGGVMCDDQPGGIKRREGETKAVTSERPKKRKVLVAGKISNFIPVLVPGVY